MRTPQLSFTYMYLLLLVLDPGGGAVGDPFLTIGLPIIAVAVLAIPIVLVSTILLTYSYSRFVFIIINAVEYMLCLGYFHMLIILSSHLQVMVCTSSCSLSGDGGANRRM